MDAVQADRAVESLSHKCCTVSVGPPMVPGGMAQRFSAFPKIHRFS